MNTKLAIVLAYNDIFKGGKIAHDDPSILRMRALLRAVESSYSTLICTAGYGCKNPELPNKDRDFSLSRQIGSYFNAYIKIEEKRCITPFFRPYCWSTENEVKYGIKIAVKENMANSKEVVTLYIASNKQHLKRIKMYTDRYAPKNWIVQLIPVKDGLHGPINYFMELGKRIRDYIKFKMNPNPSNWYLIYEIKRDKDLNLVSLFYFIKIC